MQYRVFLASLFVLIVFAYMDTAAIMRSLNEKHLISEYESSNKILGIGVENIDATTVKVVRVLHNTPAQRSGLSIGDIIVRVGKKEVRSAEEFKNDINSSPLDKKVSLTIFKPDKNELRTLSLLPEVSRR